MKFLVYLMTMLFVGSAIAQNPTILQGSYISNVFGNSNFVLNPNAQTNIANVTTVTATVTRSTTTPLVATSEFTVAIGTANGTATWATRAFDAGMKGQNCEARFSYRGFAATSKVHIKQGANAVASLTLTPATDPRIASINFPCGDLSAATTFQVTDTAILAGTNEIGGIYVGLATNMANVAQAEEVGSIFIGSGCNWDRTGAGSNSFGNFTANASCPTPVATGAADTTAGKIPGGKFNNLKPGKYLFMISYPQFKQGSISDWVGTRLSDGSTYGPTYFSYMQQTGELWSTATSVWQVEYTTVTSPTIQLQGKTENTANTIRVYNDSANAGGIRLTAYRFPSASELVVTPERQNTFGGAQWTGSAFFPRNNTTEITVSSANFATNRTLFGKAQFTGTANDVAITIPSMPPGSYKVQLAGRRLSTQKSTVGTTDFGCDFTIKDGTNSTSIRVSQYGSQYLLNSMPIVTGVFTYSSLADRTFTAYLNGQDTNPVDCQVDSPKIIITPLDQPSNSALYVQGPVLGAQTGAAIPAGYVGEMRANEADTCGTSGVYGDGASITVTPGVWSVNLYASLNVGVAVNDFLAWIGTSPGNNQVWRLSFINDAWLSGWTLGKVSITPPVGLIRYDGTNFYRLRNNVWSDAVASATGILYAKRYRDTSACGSLVTVLTATRIN